MKIPRLLLVLFLSVLWEGVNAQVFPGDANNNGEVNNIDILYIGHAYGEVGPSRLENGSSWNEQTISVPWNNDFSNGVNYTFADANGNGMVEITDFFTVIFNYGLQQSEILPDEFIPGTAGSDPALNFEIGSLPGNLTAGSLISIPIRLGSEAQPLTNCNGLAFTIEYNSDILHLVDFHVEGSFMTADQQYFPLLYESLGGELDVAITRFGQDPVGGWGDIGVLSMIIEDNLIDFLPEDIDSIGVVIRIKDVMVLDQEQNVVPIVNDSVEIMVHHPDALVDTNDPIRDQELRVFPNPAKDLVMVSAPAPIQYVAVMDVRGVTLAQFQANGARQLGIQTGAYAESLLLLRVYTDKGFYTKRLYKHKQY